MSSKPNTASKNPSATKSARSEAISALLKALGPDTPVALKPLIGGGMPKPLAVGIHADIAGILTSKGVALADAIELVQKALGFICGNASYLRVMAEPGAQRHDLEGSPVEPVSDPDRLIASLRLKALDDRLNENRLSRVMDRFEGLVTRLEKATAKVAVGSPGKGAEKAPERPPVAREPSMAALGKPTLSLRDRRG